MIRPRITFVLTWCCECVYLVTMLNASNIRMRRTGLTATDMAKIAGENPYGSPIQVYEDKVRPIEEALEAAASPSNAALTGQVLEAAVAQRYVLDQERPDSKLRVVNTGLTYRHPSVCWALATPDRFIFRLSPAEYLATMNLGELRSQLMKGRKADWLLECKLVGARMSRDWDASPYSTENDADRIPAYVYVQCQWQAFVCGYDRVDVAAVLSGTHFQAYTIARDEQYIQALLTIGDAFWVKVLEREPPEPDASSAYTKYLSKLAPPAELALQPAPAVVQTLLREYVQFRTQEAQANRQKVLRSQALQLMMLDKGGYEHMGAKAQWVRKKGKIDWKRLAFENAIDVEKYRGPGYRYLAVSAPGVEEDDEDDKTT